MPTPESETIKCKFEAFSSMTSATTLRPTSPSSVNLMAIPYQIKKDLAKTSRVASDRMRHFSPYIAHQFKSLFIRPKLCCLHAPSMQSVSEKIICSSSILPASILENKYVVDHIQ